MNDIQKKLDKGKINEIISFDVNAENSKKLQYLTLKRTSINNLLKSITENSNGLSKEGDLEKALELYTQNQIEYENKVYETICNVIGAENYEPMINSFDWTIDWNTNKLKLTKRKRFM